MKEDVWIDWCREISNQDCCSFCHDDWEDLGYNLNETYMETEKYCFVFCFCCKCNMPSEKQMREYIERNI